MRRRLFFLFVPLAVVATGLYAGHAHLSADQTPAAKPSREDAYRANNIGVALLEQFKNKEAAEEFRQALKADPTLTLARVNLGIALYIFPELAGALRELKGAV